MTNLNEILKEALALKPVERTGLVDELLSSLDAPDTEIDGLWKREAEDRIDAFERGEIKAVSLRAVLGRYGFWLAL